jgi:ParB/RepB/Spo0J family partition protein
MEKNSIQPAATVETSKGDQRTGDIFKVPLSRIRVQEDFNHRGEENYGDMEELVNSIRAVGQQTPTLGFKDGETWVVTAGHRRIMAFHEIASKTGEEPFVLIRKGPKDNAGRLIAQYAENIHHSNSEYERAKIFQGLLDTGLTKNEVIEQLGLKPQYYARLIELLSMAPSVKDHMEQGNISPNTAITINRSLKGKSEDLAAAVAAEVETTVKNAKAAGKKKATARHSEVSVTRTMQSIIKTTVKKLQEKVEAEKELTPTEEFTLNLFGKLQNKVSDRTIMDFIRKGE